MELCTRLHRRVAPIALLGFALAPFTHADPLPDATERVIGLGRMWAKVKFFRPYLAYRDIDWDAALVAAIPKAEAATTVAEYRAAVQGMLAALGDPVMRIIDALAAPPPANAPAAWLTAPSPGVVEIKLAALLTGTSRDDAMSKAKQVVGEAAKAKVLVVDMRAPGLAAFAALQFEPVHDARLSSR